MTHIFWLFIFLELALAEALLHRRSCCYRYWHGQPGQQTRLRGNGEGEREGDACGEGVGGGR